MTQNNKEAFGLSFEYFPPQNEVGAARLRQSVARHAIFKPDFVSITYGAGGTTRERTLEVLKRLSKETPLSLAGHLTAVGATRQEVLEVADSYRALGVKRIVALRGDAPKGAKKWQAHQGGFASSVELIEALADRNFDITVGAYPEKHPDAADQNADIHYLKAKFDAGAHRAITQFFFEKDKFLRLRDHAAKIGIHKPIIPGILPIENFDKMKNFAAKCAASIPSWLETAFENANSDEEKHLLSVSLACDMIENLRAEGVDHFHIYTLNNPSLAYDICTALGRKTLELSDIAVA